jgi:thiol peroxidase
MTTSPPEPNRGDPVKASLHLALKHIIKTVHDNPHHAPFCFPAKLHYPITKHKIRRYKMSKINLHGNPINTIGELPPIGSIAKDFVLTSGDLSDVSLSDYRGKKVLLNIFPSIDTGVCAASVRRFNMEAASLENTVVLGISRDLPFALQRFCGAEGIDKVFTLSEMRNRDFGKEYGLEIVDGPMAGLLARAVVIIDEAGKIVYTQLVDDIVHEPDYESALSALKE